MAAEKEAKKKKRPEKPKKPEAELQNMQINFFVMRYMWQVIRGRSKDDTIYVEFDMSRVRYTRIINAENIRFSQGELNQLVINTGLPETIFTGKTRLNLVDSKGKEIITEEHWSKWREWRKEQRDKRSRIAAPEDSDEKPKEPDEKKKDKEQSIQDTICDCLRTAAEQMKEGADSRNWEFYRLCYFLRERKPAPKGDPELQLRRAIQAVQGVSFEILDSCRMTGLQEFEKELKAKLSLIRAISIYKEYKK